ncbi:ribosome recycling factor [Mycoplasmopsis maculosa]|uniref:Ribosome-recycling factor n=1 Tax=Mycoplasmopsis maculosa TaxID=114885 RepID=A0A449B505_9BACT|nr:ribosome recycling factor [Mycoplasmopsis maculosa]VEU75681.1 ribosome recycling factor [Mycoplasmopsis maculosa]
MELDLYLLQFEEESEKTLNHFVFELSKISTGRANPQIFKGVRVNYYDALTPLEELANISVPEPQQLLIKPFDMSSVKDIIKALTLANLGVNPIDEGDKIRINFPALTTDRKKELAKGLSKYAEQAKVGIRNARQNANKNIKSDEELSEDEQKRYLDIIQKEVDKKIEHVVELTSKKEKEIMSF